MAYHRIEGARAALAARLRERLPELEAAVTARVYAISPPRETADPDYLQGLRASLSAALDYALLAIERGEERTPAVPPALLAQARMAARNRVRLDTVLRRYLAGYSLLSEVVIEEAENNGLLGGTSLQRVLRGQAAVLDRLIAAISEEHAREESGRVGSTEQRRAERVKRLLAGEPIDHGCLAYEFDAHHLGVILQGATAQPLHTIARRLDRRLLAVPSENGVIWGWFAGRAALDPADVERCAAPALAPRACLTVGEPADGVSGWRLTHRQAQAALVVARHSSERIIAYRNVALIASMLQDEVLIASVQKLYLAPLEQQRDGGETLRDTLWTYFTSGRHVSSTASAEGALLTSASLGKGLCFASAPAVLVRWHTEMESGVLDSARDLGYCCANMRLPAILLLGCLFAVFHAAAAAWASTSPFYDVKATWGDTNLPSGGTAEFQLQVRAVGEELGKEDLTITDRLPAGVTVKSIRWAPLEEFAPYVSCAGTGSELVSCHLPYAAETSPGVSTPILPRVVKAFPEGTGYLPSIFISVEVEASAIGTGLNLATVSWGGPSASFADRDVVPFAAAPSGFGVVPGSFAAGAFDGDYPAGDPVRQAGAHPFELRLAFDLDAEGPPAGDALLRSHGTISTARISMPRGFFANPEALPRCEAADLTAESCPADTQVGYLDLGTSEPELEPFLSHLPLYNLVPPVGGMADFAFDAAGLLQGHVYPALDPSRGYATEVSVPDISSFVHLRGAEVTLWGVPGDPAHDRFRAVPGSGGGERLEYGASFGSAPIRPLLTNAMDCGVANGNASIQVESYEHPGEFTAPQEATGFGDVEGCGDPRFRFQPEIEVRPSASEAGAPSGLDLRLEVPQQGDPTPPLRSAAISLPEGMTVNPSLAQGLGACGEGQIGLVSAPPPRFDAAPPSCPESSRIGTVRAVTPLLPEPVGGTIYLAAQDRNPFHSLLALYLVLEDPARGLLVKIPARIDLDGASGQIAVTLDDLPQLPIAELALHLKAGPRGAVLTPGECGQHAAGFALASWADPAPVRGAASFPLDEGCSPGGFHPGLSAGTANPLAGRASPLTVELSRRDGEPQLSDASLVLPPGLVARFGRVPRCPDPFLAAGACPAASRIGSAAIAVGAGSAPLWIPQPDGPPASIYLAGSYRGAPFGLAVVVPARAGPLDLGTVVEHAAVSVDPRTAQATVRLDPLPRVLDGVPLLYRAIRLEIDRPGFVLNPTSCDETAVEGSAVSVDGATAPLSVRFQAAHCASLGLRPRLSLRMSQATGRDGHPSLRVLLRPRPGDARLRRTALLLPRGEYLDPGHIRDVCTRALFAAGRCPARSAAGWVKAWSPLLARPLLGRVFLRESDRRLPDLAAELHGEVGLRLLAHLSTPHARLLATLAGLPDVPVSRLELVLAGGRRGLVVNSRGLCGAASPASRAAARFVGHNGRERLERLSVRPDCGRPSGVAR